MTYTKPTILELSNAVETIHGSTHKGPFTQLEYDNIHYNGTSTAYEADE